LSAQAVMADPVLRSPLNRLPLVTLYLTERCNSRCVTCDYWRHGRVDMSLDSVTRLLPQLRELRTDVVLLSGGEPLLNPHWPAIAELLRAAGMQVWLVTSGLALAKHARRVAELFDRITVSLDGTDSATYAAIRGLDAFDKVCQGIRAAVSHGKPPSIRVTLQRANFRQLSDFVGLAKQLGAREISFLAVDIANPHAFGRTDDYSTDLALCPTDLPIFKQCLESSELDYAAEFRSGFIAECPAKLQRIYQYFAAIQGHGPYPQVRCNAPEFSAVVSASHQVQPCFFIAGPTSARLFHADGRGAELPAVLNSDAMMQLRAEIRGGRRRECKTCVCSMWRDLGDIGAGADSVRFAVEASA
jgi:MoaA/NifB/PqqE/SkfB family radical SAM enzyme